MNALTGNLLLIVGALLAGAASVVAFIILRQRKKDRLSEPFKLEEFVTLDSQGWSIVSLFAAAGAVVMIASSAAIGVAYWTGLAIEGDVSGGVIDPTSATGFFGFFEFMTVGVVGFFFLALVFETFSDLGVPLASGMAGRKKPLLPQLVLAATLGCIVMSVVTKWGYYDDKREFRVTQLEQEVEADTQWHDAKVRAEATISRLGGTPSVKVAEARFNAAQTTISRLEGQIEKSEAALALIPASHSTNRNAAQRDVNDLYSKLAEAEREKITVEGIKEDRAALDKAEASLVEANAEILALVGSKEADGSVRVKAGDSAWVRVFRVGIHQFLCWLFPMLWFEGRAAYRDAKKKEEANEKRRRTNADKRNTFDADYDEIDPEEDKDLRQLSANGYYEDRAAAEEVEIERLRKEQEEREARARQSDGYENGEGGRPDKTQPEAVNDDDDRTRNAG